VTSVEKKKEKKKNEKENGRKRLFSICGIDVQSVNQSVNQLINQPTN